MLSDWCRSVWIVGLSKLGEFGRSLDGGVVGAFVDTRRFDDYGGR